MSSEFYLGLQGLSNNLDNDNCLLEHLTTSPTGGGGGGVRWEKVELTCDVSGLSGFCVFKTYWE